MALPLIISATSASSGGSTVVTTTPLSPDTALDPDGTTLNPLGVQTTTFVPYEPDPDDNDPDPDGGGSGVFTPGVAGTAGSGRSTPGSAGSPGSATRVTVIDPFQSSEPGAPEDSTRDI